MKRKLHSKKIPSSLTNLLSFSKKSQADQYAKKIVLEEFELFLLLLNCEQMGFRHRGKFPEYRPNHLTITKSDTDNLKQHNFRPYSKKISALMKERRQIYAHLLERDVEWHCFYFSYNDIAPKETNHHRYGPHIHYVSHLWTYDKEETWKRFDTRFTEIGDAPHIKFKPFEYPETLTERLSHSTDNPVIFAINTNLPVNGNSRPIPLAEITTRGSLTADISLHPKLKNQFIKGQYTNKDIIISR